MLRKTDVLIVQIKNLKKKPSSTILTLYYITIRQPHTIFAKNVIHVLFVQIKHNNWAKVNDTESVPIFIEDNIIRITNLKNVRSCLLNSIR